MTSKFCLEQLGQATRLTPRCLNPRDLSKSEPTLTSSTGSEASETRIVSPMPSINNDPNPIDDFTVPERWPPASVIPR